MNSLLKSTTLQLIARYLRLFPSEAPALMTLQMQLVASDNPFVRTNMFGHITTSAAVLDPSLQRILLIDHVFLGRWLPPGGHYEGEGSFWESACREVEEETGVSHLALHAFGHYPDMDMPLDINTHAVPANPAKNEGAHLHHDFRFLAISHSTADLTPQLVEVHGARWAPIEELANETDPRLQTLYQKIQLYR